MLSTNMTSGFGKRAFSCLEAVNSVRAYTAFCCVYAVNEMVRELFLVSKLSILSERTQHFVVCMQ